MTQSKKRTPWDRQMEESAQAYAAFVVYRDLGATRSVDAAYRAAKGLQESNKRAPGRWREWSTIYDWETRAILYDDHLAEIEEKARQKATEESATLLAKRRAEQKETELTLSAALIEKAKFMLDWPLARTVVEQKRDKKGNVIAQTILEPVRWQFRDLVRMLDLASKLGRLGLDMRSTTTGAFGEAGADEDGNVQWTVKLPPDVDEETWLTIYRPKVIAAQRSAEVDIETVEKASDKVM